MSFYVFDNVTPHTDVMITTTNKCITQILVTLKTNINMYECPTQTIS